MNLDELDAALEERTGDLQLRLPELNWLPLPERVFHYTDAAGLAGILGSKTIWATDYRFMNDSSELAYVREVARDVARAVRVRDEGDDDVTRAFLAAILATDSDPSARSEAPYYLACFSESDDSLSQWRAYGGRHGYALEFPGDISSEPDYEATHGQNPGLTLLQVRYERTFHEKYVSQMINEMIQYVCRASDVVDAAKTHGAAAVAALFTPLVWGLLERVSYRFKHPAFSEEKEWRLVSWGDREPLFRASPDLTPYVNMTIHSGWRRDVLPLQGVRHGPTETPRRTLDALDRLLDSHGYSAESCARSGSLAPARL